MSSTDPGKQAQIGFIGGGNMAQSLIGGLLAKGVDNARILVSDPVKECCEQVSRMGVGIAENNEALVHASDIVILAVKPQVFRDVIAPLQDALKCSPALLISIAAGVTTQSIERWAGRDVPVVRCMPNTPALLREGATALFANDAVSKSQREQAEQVLKAVGLAVWVKEETALDAVTAVSGSGPAYFFLLMELMTRAGEKMGLDTELAEKLTLQTALGAAKMASSSDVNVAELRRRVTSPNGTTHAAVETFLTNGLAEQVEKALLAAHDRSAELALELGGD